MIRLLLLALLVLNLQGKEDVSTTVIPIDNPQESLNTPTPAFIQLLTTLQQTLQTAKDKTSKLIPPQGMPYSTYLSTLQKNLDSDQIWKLAHTALDQVPLFEAFNPANAYEQDFLEHTKTFEAMHLIGMFDDTPIPKMARRFLETLNFFYKPFFEAKKRGLEMDAYLHYLAKSPVPQRRLDAYNALGIYGSAMKDYLCFNPDGIAQNLVHDVGYLYKPHGAWGIFNDWFKALIASMLNQDAGYMEKHGIFAKNLANNPQLAPFDAMQNLYAVHVLRVIKDIDAYVDLQDISPEILQKRPTICLNPNYLNPALKQACQTLLAKPHPAFKKQLELLGILIMDNVPCVALNPNQTPLFFHTKDAFCQALQTSFKKEF
ncbi:hypothetical protein [Helicobacter bizzozeronii]|uniref:hypothetical protein n=1 Tax=Helicobacter bizzozeronii TaxID=56877 RepID=UPI000CEE8AA7|nr:hypothetical protein [Helicobacter bizzozeronii]